MLYANTTFLPQQYKKTLHFKSPRQNPLPIQASWNLPYSAFLSKHVRIEATIQVKTEAAMFPIEKLQSLKKKLSSLQETTLAVAIFLNDDRTRFYAQRKE